MMRTANSAGTRSTDDPDPVDFSYRLEVLWGVAHAAQQAVGRFARCSSSGLGFSLRFLFSCYVLAYVFIWSRMFPVQGTITTYPRIRPLSITPPIRFEKCGEDALAVMEAPKGGGVPARPSW